MDAHGMIDWIESDKDKDYNGCCSSHFMVACLCM